MSTLAITTLAAVVLTFSSINLFAAEICKVSMMGRVCFEEGSPEAAAHMKGDAVAEAAASKKKAALETAPKKVADNSK